MSFFCCGRGQRSPTSNGVRPSPQPNAAPAKHTAADAAHAPDQSPSASKAHSKLSTIYVDEAALLPGQLPGTPRDDEGMPAEIALKAGIMLLEDALNGKRRGSTASHQEGPAPSGREPTAARVALPPLHVPPPLRCGSGTFDSEFTSDADTRPSSGAHSHPPRNDSGTHVPSPRGNAPSTSSPHASGSAPHGELTHTVARASGSRRLLKMVDLTPVDAPERALVAQQRLQRELRIGTELPRDEHLLLPQRVYNANGAVRVVYDGDGEELYSYLKARQRLPESLCRSVLVQLLEALASMHAEHWLHRNVSTESVWVVEEQLPAPHAASANVPGLGGSASAVLLRLGPPVDERAAGRKAAAAPHAAPAPAPPPPAPAAEDSDEPPPPPRAGSSATAAQHGEKPAAAAAPPLSLPSPSTAAAAAADGGGTGPGGAPPLAPPGAEDGPLALARTYTLLRRDGTSRRMAQPLLAVKLGGLAHAVRAPPGGEGALDAEHAAAMRQLVGCAYHLAPEVIRGGAYSPAADVWAAGVLLYMLLTGRPPFPGANELEVMTRILMFSDGHSPLEAGSNRRGVPPPSTAGPQPAAPPTFLASSATFTKRPGGGSADGGPDSPERQSPSQPMRSLARGWSSVTRVSGDGNAPGAGPRPDALQLLVVQAVLEARASPACRQVLAAMLAGDPQQRLSAAQLLKLPFFHQH